MAANIKTKVKCPKCKSVDLVLIEVWTGHTITWEQSGGLIDKQQGNLESGDPCKMQARCSSCSHHWTIRGALQVNDVFNISG